MDLRGLLTCFLLFYAVSKLALADQEGFLSLSCGGATTFVDSFNISWTPDISYITTGNTSFVNFLDGTFNSSVPLRFFPDSQQFSQCYRLPVQNLSAVLIRPQFYYKNYDGLNKPPSFTVSLGTALTSTIDLTKSDPWVDEFIWPVTKDTLTFCLHPFPNSGFPVISSLEVRPLPHDAYESSWGDFHDAALKKRFRVNCGYTNGSLRYPVDTYDRIWDPDQYFSPVQLSTGFNIQVPFSFLNIQEGPPISVLQSARVLARKDILSYNFPLGIMGDYYIVLYFAGILRVSSSFNILINGEVVRSNYIVKSSEASIVTVKQRSVTNLNITLQNINFYPLVNAIEVYEIVEIPSEVSSTTGDLKSMAENYCFWSFIWSQSCLDEGFRLWQGTELSTHSPLNMSWFSALQVIQQSMGLEFGWQDDPCSPTPWEHIDCEGSLVTSLELSDMKLRAISPTFGDLIDLKKLDLHNASLAGEIQNLGSLQQLETLNLSFNRLTSFGSELGTLVSLQILDLQNNSLQGTVPNNLGSLKDLHLLNLENNKLQGPLPQSLNKESLEVRTSGNLCLSFSTTSCDDLSDHPSIPTPQVTLLNVKKPQSHNRKAILLGTIVGASCVVLLLTLSVFLYRKKRKDANEASSRNVAVDMRSWNSAKIFSYKEIKVATNNFKDVIGRGSFGSVYLGKLSDGKLVAVKVRFDKTQLGADSFINEVRLLSQVRHQNLVSLEGFCYESKQQILVYEYLSGGSLADSLYGSNGKKVALNWVRRLKIAVDAAKGDVHVTGLDYLHNGSDPRIIHRDVKCSNILLDMEMNARVCDFGLCKQIPQADATHVTTVVKGTAGYLDPEYYSSQQLTEKSDVYSFGVVLLELICGREPLSHAGTPDSFNLVLWAKPYLQAGAFEIVDECLRGTYDVESMRKVVSVATRSVERDGSQRPTMAEVLAELKAAYSIQLEYLASQSELVN